MVPPAMRRHAGISCGLGGPVLLPTLHQWYGGYGIFVASFTDIWLANPSLHLKTTYKQRCLRGLKHPDPDSPRACHKPARGAFSKYCSQECGIKYMESRIDSWAKKGGKTDRLLDGVRGAQKREGVVVRINEADSDTSANESEAPNSSGKLKSSSEHTKNGYTKPSKPLTSKVQREKERLNQALDQVVRMGNDLKKGLEVLTWREKLLELASERSESAGTCGWDRRLCMGDEEWADRGQGILESYEDRGEADMDVDGNEGDGEWWCEEEAACSRHMGCVLTVTFFDRHLYFRLGGRILASRISPRRKRRKRKPSRNSMHAKATSANGWPTFPTHRASARPPLVTAIVMEPAQSLRRPSSNH